MSLSCVFILEQFINGKSRSAKKQHKIQSTMSDYVHFKR